MSNESVAAELRKLLMKNNQLEQLLLANWVAGDNPGAIVNIPGLAEGIAELLEEAAHTGSLEPLIARLEAPTMTPTMADEIMAKRIKEECWDPDCETFDLAHCQALVGLHRMAPDPALEELRQAARDEALREVENAISYFFDTHKGTINTNVACDTLLGRVKALAKFSQPSGKPEKAK